MNLWARSVLLSRPPWGDLNALNEYDAAVANGTGKKMPKCWKVEQCDFLDADLSVHHDVQLNACCDLGHGVQSGTCRLKAAARRQVNSKGTACWLPTGTWELPEPIVLAQSGIVAGDLKLITGGSPPSPNASTPWTVDHDVPVPGFACSVPGKRACLFNVTADAGEHHDLALDRPADR
eukprot:gene6215-26635_t